MANGNGGAGSSSFRPATGPGLEAGPGVTFPGAPAGGGSLLGGGPVPGPGGAGFTFAPIQGAGFQPGGGVQGFTAPTGRGPESTVAGQGGFTASPRLLSGGEIIDINRELGLTGFERFSTTPFRRMQQLGPFGFIADPTSFSRGEVPFIETRLNFENLLQAQQDRESALGLLQGQRNVIGTGPDQLAALEVARRRLAQPEPFTPEEVALQTGQIRSRAARGLESSERRFSEDIARQGLAGSATSFQGAQLQQAADRQASDELSRLAIENALRRDINEAQAVDRLQGITGETELRQIALNQALSELLTASRGQFDLSALAGKERKADAGALSRIGFF